MELPGWCISDLDQWIADLDDTQFWPPEEEPEPERERDARPYPETKKFDTISDDNDLLEILAIILLTVDI